MPLPMVARPCSRPLLPPRPCPQPRPQPRPSPSPSPGLDPATVRSPRSGSVAFARASSASTTLNSSGGSSLHASQLNHASHTRPPSHASRITPCLTSHTRLLRLTRHPASNASSARSTARPSACPLISSPSILLSLSSSPLLFSRLLSTTSSFLSAPWHTSLGVEGLLREVDRAPQCRRLVDGLLILALRI